MKYVYDREGHFKTLTLYPCGHENKKQLIQISPPLKACKINGHCVPARPLSISISLNFCSDISALDKLIVIAEQAKKLIEKESSIKDEVDPPSNPPSAPSQHPARR